MRKERKMLKVIVLDKTLDANKMNISKTDTCVIITTPEGLIPAKIVEKLTSAKVRFEFMESMNPATVAFTLGKLSEKEKISEVITDMPDIMGLFGKASAQKIRTPKAAAKPKQQAKVQDASDKPTQDKKKKAAGEELKKEMPKDAMNPPVSGTGEAKSSPIKSTGRKTKDKKEKSYTSSTFKDIPEQKVREILKNNKFDEKYLEPVMKALSMATDISLDLYVRTQVAVVEEDKEICKQIGEVFKKELVG